MKKLFALTLALALTCCSFSALAAGKLSVTQENFWVISSYWADAAYAYAKVENAGDKAIDVNAGILEIYDEKGDVITSGNYLQVYPKTLQPGEYTYVSLAMEVQQTKDLGKPEGHQLTLAGKTDDESATVRLPAELKLAEGEWWKADALEVTVTNNTEETLYGIQAVFAVLDAEGNILWIDSDSQFAAYGLTPGSSAVIRREINQSFVNYFTAKGVTPASVDVIAYVNR